MATRRTSTIVYSRAGRWFARVVVDGQRVSVPIPGVDDEASARAVAITAVLHDSERKGLFVVREAC
jgi:hypothetical protein